MCGIYYKYMRKRNLIRMSLKIARDGTMQTYVHI